MYVCMYVCMYVYMYVSTYVCMYVCMYVYSARIVPLIHVDNLQFCLYQVRDVRKRCLRWIQ